MKKFFTHIFCGLTALGLFFSIVSSVYADSTSTDFENFTLGSVDGQGGWTSGSGYASCPVFDVAVVANAYGYPSFGTQSLRISNAITCGGIFVGQTFSPLLTDEAGETAASTSTSPGGTREPYFEAQWDFASTQPGSEQPGLSIVASPSSAGSRMSWIQMQDTPTGLELDFIDYQISTSAFVETPIATGIDRTVPHTVKVTMRFIDGPSNDIVNVYLDGVLIHTGTSWEDYYGAMGTPPTAINSVMFRISGTAVPALLGQGFLIDNFSSETGLVPVPPAVLHVVSDNEENTASSTLTIHVEQNGTDIAGSPALGTTTPGVLYSLSPGVYAISEDADASYVHTFSGDCDADGNITLASGDDKTCTIIGSDISTSTPVISVPPATSAAPSNSSNGGHSSGGNSGGNGQNIPTADSNIFTTVTTTTVVSNTLPSTSTLFTNHLSQDSVYNISADVTRLQTLLATEPTIYPEGFVTGYFGPLTFAAVQNFQVANDVVDVGGVGSGTVGPLTRAALQKVFGE